VKSLCIVLRIITVCGFCVDVQCATEGRNVEWCPQAGLFYCILDGRCIRVMVGTMLAWPREETSGRNVGGEAPWKKLSS
jgi:hypothetical protein